MELALYHPRYGYYTKALGGTGVPARADTGTEACATIHGALSKRERIGKQGDYFTSVSVGSLFGKILAKQFVKFREELGNPPEFAVVEFGGYRGQLRADVLAAAPDLSYRIVEAGDPLPDSIVGCVFSNEFLDALPVHLVQVKDGTWQEVYVKTASPHPNPLPQGERGKVKRRRL